MSHTNWAYFTAIACVLGCSDGPGAAADAGTDTPLVEAAADVEAYPADHPAAPQVVNVGGPVVAHPKIVPITFPNDPLRPDIDTFVAAFAKTTYWGDVGKEYGVSAAVPLAPIHATDVIAKTIDDSEIQTWLASMVDGTHSEFPTPDGDTIYTLYYPPGTTVTYGPGAASCVAFHGYHNEVALPNAAKAIYAVVSRCDSLPEASVTGIQYVSAVTSHEVFEAMTDPFVESSPAYAHTDLDHIAYSMLSLAELGDMCTLVGHAFFTPTDFPYTVQRMWSNAQALAGHDPCVPTTSTAPYVSAAPVMTDDIPFAVNGLVGKTKGVKIPVGTSKTIDLDLFSDGPTDAWTVSALNPAAASLSFALDRSSGVNGDHLSLTITALSKNQDYGVSPFIVASAKAPQRNLWVGVVGN